MGIQSRFGGLATLVVALLATHAVAQDITQTPAPEAQATTQAAVCCTLAVGTPVELEIAEALSSAQAKRGEKFAIVLRTPLSIDGTLVVPAGTTGVGEIVHADRARGGGKAGELLLAARYLEWDGKRIPLRGMKLGAVGTDRTKLALVLGLVRGGEVEVAKGTVANAKLAEPLALTTPTTAPIPALPATVAAPPAFDSNTTTTAVPKE